MSDPISEFELEKKLRVESYPGFTDMHNLSLKWLQLAFEKQYMYNLVG